MKPGSKPRKVGRPRIESDSDSLSVPIRMTRATLTRLRVLSENTHLSLGETLAQVLRRGESWTSLWAMLGSGEFEQAPEARRAALALLAKESELRVELSRFAAALMGQPVRTLEGMRALEREHPELRTSKGLEPLPPASPDAPATEAPATPKEQQPA